MVSPGTCRIKYTDLQFVLNTTWDIIRDGEDGPLFLCYAGNWLTAGALDGDWQWATSLPGELQILPADANWDGARNCLPDDLDQVAAPNIDVPKFSTRRQRLNCCCLTARRIGRLLLTRA